MQIYISAFNFVIFSSYLTIHCLPAPAPAPAEVGYRDFVFGKLSAKGKAIFLPSVSEDGEYSFFAFLFWKCMKKLSWTQMYNVLFGWAKHTYPFVGFSQTSFKIPHIPTGVVSCSAKHGDCIRRKDCIGKKMLYLSGGCYYLDYVCCYEDRNMPVVFPDQILPITNETATNKKTWSLMFVQNKLFYLDHLMCLYQQFIW